MGDGDIDVIKGVYEMLYYSCSLIIVSVYILC